MRRLQRFLAVSAVVLSRPFPLTGQTISISKIDPPSVAAGSSSATLTVTGAGFRGASVCSQTCGTSCPQKSLVSVDGTDLTTTFVSATSLTAPVPTSLLVTPRNASVRVHNDTVVQCQGLGGSTISNTVTLAVVTDLTLDPLSLPRQPNISVGAGLKSDGSDSVSVVNTGPGVTVTAKSNDSFLLVSLTDSQAVTAGAFKSSDSFPVAANDKILLWVQADARTLHARQLAYTGSITVSASGRPTRTLTVTVGVTGIDIGLNPTSLTIQVPFGSSNIGTFSVINVFGASNVAVTISDPKVSWLQVSNKAPNVGQTVTLTARGAGFQPGPQSTSLTVTAVSSSPSIPQVLPVTMVVNPLPVLTPVPANLNLTAIAGAPSASGQLQIQTSGDPVPFTAATNQAWLTVQPTSASASTTLNVTADLSKMLPGAPSATITITPSVAGVQQISVGVSVQIKVPVLSAQPSSLPLTGTAGAPTATGQVQLLTDSGQVPVSLTSNQPWLSAQASSSQAPTGVTITADLVKLGATSGSGMISVTPGTSGVQAISIQVTVQVKSAPVLTAKPSPLTLTATAGAATVSGQIQITSDSDAVPFTVSASDPWLTAISFASGTRAAVNVTADLAKLGSGNPSGSISIKPGTPGVQSVTVQVDVQTPGKSGPAITDVLNGASFKPSLASRAWIAIKGTNFTSAANCDAIANPGPGCRIWTDADFVNGTPTSLDNVSVSIGGKPAFVYYISPTQINVQAPDVGPGQVQVVVTSPGGTSSPFTVNIDQFAPAFFLANGYAIATHLDFSLVAPAGSCPGCKPAARGETVVLWGTGFGPSIPNVPAGQLPGGVTGSVPASVQKPSITIGGVPTVVGAAVLAPQSIGLAQIAVTIPNSVPSGDQLIVATSGGKSSPDSGVLVTIQ
jgi:uncharacterized protein (TIGR03437 family)